MKAAAGATGANVPHGSPRPDASQYADLRNSGTRPSPLSPPTAPGSQSPPSNRFPTAQNGLPTAEKCLPTASRRPSTAPRCLSPIEKCPPTAER
jgi:hypothetical protein